MSSSNHMRANLITPKKLMNRKIKNWLKI